MSKGSRFRPFDYEAFSENYDKIFGKKRKVFYVDVGDLPPEKTQEALDSIKKEVERG